MRIIGNKALSVYLQDQRKHAGRSQQDVAQNTGLQQQTISAFESASANARISTLFAIVNELGLELHIVDPKKEATLGDKWTESW